MPYSPQSRHYSVLKKLYPIKNLGNEQDIDLDVKGLQIDEVENMAISLLDEICASSSTNDSNIGIISKFEEMLGIIPDNNLDIQTRRNKIIAKMVAPSGINADFYYTISEKLNYNRYPSVADPHIRILAGQFKPFLVGYSLIGIDKLYDQMGGYSQFTILVTGSAVESDNYLQSIFNDLKPACAEFIFQNE